MITLSRRHTKWSISDDVSSKLYRVAILQYINGKQQTPNAIPNSRMVEHSPAIRGDLGSIPKSFV